MNTNNLHTLNFISDELDDDVLILFSDVIISKKLLSICKQSKDDFNLLIDKNNVTDKTMRVLIKNKLIVTTEKNFKKYKIIFSFTKFNIKLIPKELSLQAWVRLKLIPKSANAFLLMLWYLSTISCGETPSFLARKVMAAPCSSEPQIKATS